MQRLTVRLAVAILTFAVGVAAASLWLFNRQEAVPEQGRWTPVAAVDEKNGPEPVTRDTPTPEVKWFYISSPVKWEKYGWAYGTSIVIFYANGDWGRVSPSIKREGKTLYTGYAEGYSAEIGKWRMEADGSVTVTRERGKCYLCFVTSEDVRPRPIVERWTVRGGTLGQPGKILKAPNEKYRLLKREELQEPEEVASTPYGVWDDDEGLGTDF